MADLYVIASDLFKEVLERRRGKGEIPLPRFDRGYELDQPVSRRDESQREVSDRREIPVWHVHV